MSKCPPQGPVTLEVKIKILHKNSTFLDPSLAQITDIQDAYKPLQKQCHMIKTNLS